jgi:predicted ribosome quality control (RQC) complex YloA/Tae2 family protein
MFDALKDKKSNRKFVNKAPFQMPKPKKTVSSQGITIPGGKRKPKKFKTMGK